MNVFGVHHSEKAADRRLRLVGAGVFRLTALSFVPILALVLGSMQVGAWVDVAGASGSPGSSGAIGSSTFGSFDALGRADGLSIEIDDPSAPIVSNGQLIFASDSSSQAELNSLGQSEAFASVPYPGPLISSLPNLINGLFAGQVPPLPSYPLYVSSQYPTTPTDTVTQGPYQMTATSSTTDARALGAIGAATTPSVANVSATSEATQNADGSVSASASSAIKALDLGPGSLLQIDGVQTTATTSQVPGEPLQTSSSLSVAMLQIGGIAITVSDQGLRIAGKSVSLPVAQTLSSLMALLSAQGITLSFLPVKHLADGIQSAALKVQEQKNVPGQGNVVVTLTLGGVLASIDSAVTAPLPDTASSLPTTSTGTGTTSLPFTDITGPTISSPVSSSGPTTATSTATTGSVPRRFYELVRHALHLNGSASLVYLALVAGALVALAETELFRRLAVQLKLFRRASRSSGNES